MNHDDDQGGTSSYTRLYTQLHEKEVVVTNQVDPNVEDKEDTVEAIFGEVNITTGASTPDVQVANLRKDLEDLQLLIDDSPLDLSLKEKESLCMKEFVEASSDEESFLKQKAKVIWLEKGDANTKYFHNMLKCKNNKKMIASVMRSTGEVLEGDAMVNEFVTFYESFLGGEHAQPRLPDSNIFSSRLDANISLGRIQLVRSVLSSMHIFWAAAFLIPSYTAKEIEVKIRRFLWGAKQERKVNAKVAWKKVCLPKLEGGLGIRSISDMNMALMGSHIWRLLTNFPSLSSISIPFRTNGEDKLCWREGSKLIPFSTSNAWEHIRHKEENVVWAECVWFPQCIPKHAFNMWLICQGEE
ncbi:hypothetical protein QVD17_07167 [Tagetes erecta]|uniref:Reverse transcriptase zinc-binding domain-containing protein n=1 Tax=Tagetes erecta TaxID=13708 RepID=A0AAD8LEZ2_TARER|nr:hypothetical protein QVD17_07167 [Tagetes erecta]